MKLSTTRVDKGTLDVLTRGLHGRASIAIGWSIKSPDLSPIESICTLIAERLNHHLTSLFCFLDDEEWHRFEEQLRTSFPWNEPSKHSFSLCLSG
ncbi:hypothetical protein TNCV_107261 [Trichonephila clavipes]|nr:hypothetical protein TNCV_107261 [Trichonephila clavipes]